MKVSNTSERRISVMILRNGFFLCVIEVIGGGGIVVQSRGLTVAWFFA